MTQRHLANEPQWRVVCVWCGSTMSTGGVKDSSRMCKDCFDRMIGDYISANQRGNAPEQHASER